MNNLSPYSFPTPNGGILLSTQSVPNGNMLGSTGQLLLLSAPFEGDHLYTIGIRDCLQPNGSYSRYPDSIANTSVDDYLALSSSQFLAQGLYWSCLKRLGFLDVTFPKGFQTQCMIRFQGFWQHTKISAGHLVWPVGRFLWALSIYLAARQPLTNQDSWIESHMMVIVFERSQKLGKINSLLMSAAVRYWRQKKGSTTTAQISADYMGIPDHPLVQAWEPYG